VFLLSPNREIPFISTQGGVAHNGRVADFTSNVISLVLADDHPLFRSVIIEILAKERDLWVLADVADGANALEVIKKHLPRVAILDVEMPGVSGLDVVRQMRRAGIDTAVVLLTIHKEAHVVRSAFELGVFGYVVKDDLDADLVMAIRAAAEKRNHFSQSLRAQLISGTPAEMLGNIQKTTPLRPRD
jgi:DNA-binding NarL/FixJ family response regulator